MSAISDELLDKWDRLRSACERVECSLPTQLSESVGDLRREWREFHELMMSEAKK